MLRPYDSIARQRRTLSIDTILLNNDNEESQTTVTRRSSQSQSPFEFLRLLAGAVMAALASLTLFDAPVWPLLLLRIVVTELGYALALPAIALLAGARGSRAARAGGVLGLLAALLGLAPALRAALVGRRLPAQLAEAFGDAPLLHAPDAPPRPAPLVVADLLRGVYSPPVRRER